MTLLAGDFVDAALAPGYVIEHLRNTVSPNITTTETVVQMVSFQAVTGARYKITATQSFQSNVAGDLIRVRLRWDTGASVDASGNEFMTQLPNADIAGRGQVLVTVKTLTGLPAGQVTVGVTFVREGGSGTVLSFGDSRQTNTILVERV